MKGGRVGVRNGDGESVLWSLRVFGEGEGVGGEPKELSNPLGGLVSSNRVFSDAFEIFVGRRLLVTTKGGSTLGKIGDALVGFELEPTESSPSFGGLENTSRFTVLLSRHKNPQDKQ